MKEIFRRNTLKIYLLFLGLFPLVCYSQHTFSGVVTDSVGSTISGVSVYSRQSLQSPIGQFSITDAKGAYKITVNSKRDSIILEFNHMNYSQVSVKVQNASQIVNQVLNSKNRMLDEVVVEASPIYKRKDTINYNVEAFTGKEDRVIGDIIKKLPGIEVEGGKIMYQGKPIQKYFINGLDLLEGRYALANDNLPAEAVLNVQVIENDQPIKILDSLVFSDRASLNIQLKKITTTGTAELGAGLLPALWKVNITPMVFNKSFQTISTIQSNNIGEDVSKQLLTLGTGTSFDDEAAITMKADDEKPLVELQSIAEPGFDQRKWLKNHSNLASTNVLYKSKNDLETKFNLSYLNDYQERVGATNTLLYTEDQTINITEDVRNDESINELKGGLILLKNKKNIYFKNNLLLATQWNDGRGTVIRNTSDNILQRSMKNRFQAANGMTATSFIGKKLITLNSFVYYAHAPQSLVVTPGQFENLLIDSSWRSGLFQYITSNNFRTTNSASLTSGLGAVTFVPRLGVDYQIESLKSNLKPVHQASDGMLDIEFLNDLRYRRLRGFFEVKTQYKSPSWKIDLTLPLNYQRYAADDRMKGMRDELTKVTVNPFLLALYSINAHWQSGLRANYGNRFGEVNNMYNGYLMHNYRNLGRFETVIPESSLFSYSAFINHKNPLEAKFVNFYYLYSVTKNNYLIQGDIDENGLLSFRQIKKVNNQTTHSISTDYSKFFVAPKTILKAGLSWRHQEGDYLLNNVFSRLHTDAFSVFANVNFNKLTFVSLLYGNRSNLIRGTMASSKLNTVFTNNQTLSINLFPINNQILSFGFDYYHTNLSSPNNQLFLDIKYRVSVKRSKIDLELNCSNVLNNHSYAQAFNSDYAVVNSSFQLRPRQIMATIKFKL